MLRSNLISSKTENGQKCYFPDQSSLGSISNEDLNTHTLNETQKKTLNIIKSNPGITKKELLRKTGMKKDTLTYNIQRLQKLSFIWKVRSGRNTGYECITRERLRDEIYRLLLDDFLEGKIDEEKFLAMKIKLGK